MSTDEYGDWTFTGSVTVQSTMVIASGSITDSSGAISFGDENLSTTGGINVGSSASGAGDTQIAIGKTFSTHSGYANAIDMVGGIAMTRAVDANNTYLLAGFDTGGTIRGYVMIYGSGSSDDLVLYSVNCIRLNPAAGQSVKIGTSILLYTTTGKARCNYYESYVATGTQPYACSSTTKNTNLNADQVDGYDLDQDVRTSASPSFATLSLSSIKSGATQVAAGAAAGELWKTASHASLPDNVLMIGV